MKFAIKGHPTRGREVIQILESLGGRNTHKWNGNGDISDGFFIDNDDIIRFSNLPKGYKLYTLEEFEKEFPFKIGDKVISLTTGLIGIIIKLKEDGCYYIKYDNGNLACGFGQNLKLYKEMKEERNIKLTLEKAREWYKKGGELKEIALQAFSEEELTKIDLPKTWKEFCENYPVQVGECWLENCDLIREKEYSHNEKRIYKNWIPARKSAEAHLAMIQLEQLRNCWWGDWKPEWSNSEKYAIRWDGDNLIAFTARRVHSFLVFPTIEMAGEFLECFRDLIEKAGDLI
jgi:hypothetical protein